MAENTTLVRKRKLSLSKSTGANVESNNCPEGSPLSKESEPESKVPYIDEPSSNLDSNLKHPNSQIEIKTELIEGLNQEYINSNAVKDENIKQENVDGLQASFKKTTISDVVTKEKNEAEGVSNADNESKAIQDEIGLLRLENEELKAKLSSFHAVSHDSIMTINFNSMKYFLLYKDRLANFIKTALECAVVINDAKSTIHVIENDDIDLKDYVVIDEAEITALSPSPSKRKRIDCDEVIDNDLFVLDTTPCINTKHNLSYVSKFTVMSKMKEENKSESRGAASCFNCNEKHNLRDCPTPKNYAKINAARKKFKSQQPTTKLRYHLEDEQRFGHLRPGKISQKLKEALGLRHNQAPIYIYRMRQLGYPPGWFNEIDEAKSELVLFDFEGKNTFGQKRRMQAVMEDKIVEYPGFNVPLEKGVKDECRLYGCPPYSKESSKRIMLEFLTGIEKRTEDNLDNCDMELSDKEVETINTLPKTPSLIQAPQDSLSPTLRELESEKLKLLAELVQQDNSNSNNSPIPADVNAVSGDSPAYQTIDITGMIDEGNEEEETCNIVPETASCVVKKSALGTPILASASPFCTLPNPENFKQNVSDIINFENLPNTTGNYDNMVGVLEKIRLTLKSLNGEKS